MIKDNDEMIIKDALNTINTPKSNIKLNVQNRITSKSQPIFYRKAVIGVCAACFCFMLCVPVLASSDSFQKLLSTINNEMELSNLKPIETISEDNGIKMEVVGSMNDNDMAVVYFTLQDLEGERVDRSVSINKSLKVISQCNSFETQFVDYDEENKIATFRAMFFGGKTLNNKDVEVTLNGFLSGEEQKYVSIDNETLKNIIGDNIAETVLINESNISETSGEGNKYRDGDRKEILKPDVKDIKIPGIDYAVITNIGILNDGLHIQTRWSLESIDESGCLFFVDESGNYVNGMISSLSFGVDSSGNTEYGKKYVEYILDMNDVNLDDLKLNGSFMRYTKYIEGNWKANFKLQSVEEKVIKCNMELSEGEVNEVKITPIGVKVHGKNLNEKYITVNMKDGTTETLEINTTLSDNGITDQKFISKLPIEVSKINSINIDNKILSLQ